MATLESPAIGNETDVDTNLGKPYKVILFNDEDHDMLEVSDQIIKAIHCTPDRAAAIMLEAHKNGRAIVITASLERCEHVESILSEIQLGTKIEEA